MTRAGIPLTDLQQRMLAGERLDPRARGYGSGFAFEIAGDLDIARFQYAFAAVVRELDALHLVIENADTDPIFRVLSSIEPDLRLHDLAGETSPRHAAKQWLERWFPAPFDHARRLFEGHLLRVAPRLHVFAFTAHHVISDGGCYPILMARLAAHYRGDDSASQPQPSFIAALEARASQPAAIQSPPVLQGEFPFAAQRVERHAAGTTRFERRFGRERTARFRSLAHALNPGKNETRATSELFFAICAAYLRRRFGLARFTVGMPLHERRTEQDRASFGLWMRPVPVEIGVEDSADLAALVAGFGRDLSSAMRSAVVPRGNRWFDVAFNAHAYRFDDFAGMPLRVHWLHRGSDPIALQFHLRGFERKSLAIAVDVNRAEMEGHEALRTIERVLDVIDRFLDQPTTKVGDLDIVPARERARVLELSAGPRVESPARRVDEWIRSAPATQSMMHRDSQRTISELRAAACRIAEHLNAADVGRGATVAIEGERGLDQIAAILGTVLAGAAFVPIDPRWPEFRATAIREDARVAAILRGAIPTLVDPQRRPLLAHARGTCDDPLYLLYTSGSTGAPKGVIGTHRGLARRIAAFDRIAPLDRHDVLAVRTPIGFVDAVAEIFTPILCDAQAALLDDAELRDPDRVLAAIERHRITRLVITPSLLRAVLDRAREPQLASLRLVMVSGEEAPSALVREFVRRVPHGRILNVYGSTEVAADVTVFDATANDDARVPIGSLIAGSQALVCDDRLRLAPIGALGELIVAGECLALGYHERPEEQRARFIAHPLDPSQRAFRTGDYARWRADGVLEYHGRRDRQVKIRGVRIELEEIEAAINTFPGVVEVAVETDEPTGSALVAFVVSQAAPPIDRDALRKHLTARVPSQGIPREFIECARLPRMSHGKVDRTALHAVRSEQPSTRSEPTTNEQRVLAVFADLLRNPTLDRNDDFFAIGGDSLLAVDAVIALERVFARPIAIAEFMQNATAAGLARHFESGRSEYDPKQLPRIITLAGPAHGTPTVCVPPAGSDPSCFLALARRLGASAPGPILGLVPRGIEPGETPDDRVETIADNYLRALDASLVSRRVRLIGRCFGGIVAFEMARRAERFGITVERLVLLDTRRPPGVAVEPRRGRLALVEADDASERSAVVLRRRAARAAHFEARAKYVGGPTDVPTVLVHCGDASELTGPQQAWTQFFHGPLSVRHFPGDHKFLMREPRVVELGNFLERELDSKLS